MLTPAQLAEVEARLDARFPEAFRLAVELGFRPPPSSQWVMLDAGEVNPTRWYGVPAEGVVFGRGPGGAWLVFLFGKKTRVLAPMPYAWEDDGEPTVEVPAAELLSDLQPLAATFDQLFPAPLAACPHCQLAGAPSPCPACGRSRFEKPGEDPDRDAAASMLGALVKAGQLVLRSPRAAAPLLSATAAVLRQAGDDAEACERIISLWEDSEDIEEFFVASDSLRPFLAGR